ncbi:uncharacterized protein [Cherax quadricarinatus]|uniref:uncharacterized protein n=1 Tax=Cherax quadricarinatus TaxID=27406 RepID=UPI002377E3DA|nr:uncharacterized protein LOC128700774 [Cherax quadricarinatus]
MGLRVLVLAACVAVILGSTFPKQDCLNFCPDPVKGHGFFICCDPNPGVCPPVRSVCPFSKFPSPPRCQKDYECGKINKCCQDVCLRYKTCKPPILY